ncbi:MAG TPA: efflux RND transporter permease subunit [Desulfosporosinus sp.]|nr:efflux RND transporter permease subunit [Desulfosporosinus sp.]
MNIGQFSLKNKYFVLAVAIAIVLFGLYAKATIKTQMSPDTNAPMTTVIVQYPGASAEDVVKDIVKPMEDEFGSLDGLTKLKSTSQDNVASIRLEFNYGMDVDKAAIDVQNSVNRIRGTLPATMKEPKVLKFSSSNKPVVTVSLSSHSADLKDIRLLAEDKIGFALQLVEGVASINQFGGNITEVQVKLDKNKLAAYGLTIDQVAKTMSQNNIKAPGGKLIDNNLEILTRVDESFKDIDDIRKLRISLADGNFVYLEALGEVNESIEKLESTYKFDGQDSIAIMITKKSDANTVEVVQNIKSELETLKVKYPFIEFKIAQDDSTFTNQMVDNMTSSVFIALLFTVILIMLFISNVSQSFVISVSMPLVFMMTLGLMKLFDMKLDMVTLSALILSIGFVVDGAIVVVENIMTHHHHLGKDISTAAIDATKEISMPVLAGVLTTLVVLVPLLFIQGFVGEMFRPLALTVIFAISSSVVVALVIIPLFTVMFDKFKFRKTEKLLKIVTVPFNNMMDSVLNFYSNLLKTSLRHRLVMYVVVLVLLLLSAGFLATNGVEMLPKFDSGTSYVSIEMKQGTALSETSKAVAVIEEILSKEKSVIGYDTQIGYEKNSNQLSDFGIMGTNQAVITINLTPRTKRKETIWEFQEKLRAQIDQIPDVQRSVVKEKGGTASGSSPAPLDIRISGPDPQLLYDLSIDLEKQIKTVKGTTNVYKSYNMDNLQLNIKLDKARVQELGLTNALVAQQIYSSIDGIKGTTMDLKEANNVNIAVEYKDEYKQSIDNMLDVFISTPQGLKIPLREIATMNEGKRANVITKEDMEYTIDILGYTDSRAFSHITKDIQKILDTHPLPSGYAVGLTGENEDLGDSMKEMIFMLGLAVIFVYLVLVPQFKSFLHPITIMVTIPLVIIGIAPALGIAGKYISMPVLLGVILLSGTVVNNAILVVDQAINNQDQGMSIEESVITAVRSRFRPIMMTALSDVVGMLPLAMQLALGSERFSPLAIAVVGGMLAATFLTMIVIPVIYVSFEEFKSKNFKPIGTSETKGNYSDSSYV